MDPHRDVFSVLHPTLQEWLDKFDQDCQENGGHAQCSTCLSNPTRIYNSLVMLGIERPPRVEEPGIPHTCDCLATIADEQKDIARAEESILWWQKFHEFDAEQMESNVKRNQERIAKDRESIALMESMHATHADFNRRVHFMLKNYKLLAKVRAVCLRDLRNQAAGKSHIAAEPSYGRELATFLVNEPKGWW